MTEGSPPPPRDKRDVIYFFYSDLVASVFSWGPTVANLKGSVELTDSIWILLLFFSPGDYELLEQFRGARGHSRNSELRRFIKKLH